jgi:tRNA1Val (adenine37-N6)-methyltransferase
MKVCTDSCLFGAWMADKLAEKIITANTILDIGTGTGLLSLMLAQKTNATIDAAEINEEAFTQAAENISSSQWKDRINIFHTNIRNFRPGKTYDLIISNPPFYENDLQSPDIQKNISKHSENLSLETLFGVANNLLGNNGHFALLLPFSRSNLAEQTALKSTFYLRKRVFVRQTTRHKFFRSMMIFQKAKPETITNNEISIKDNDNAYTNEFIDLLKGYYLNL